MVVANVNRAPLGSGVSDDPPHWSRPHPRASLAPSRGCADVAEPSLPSRAPSLESGHMPAPHPPPPKQENWAQRGDGIDGKRTHPADPRASTTRPRWGLTPEGPSFVGLPSPSGTPGCAEPGTCRKRRQVVDPRRSEPGQGRGRPAARLTSAHSPRPFSSLLSRSSLSRSAHWLPSPSPGRLRRLSHEGGRSGQARRQDLGTAPHTSL